MTTLKLYSVFHCNIAFSSIPESDYPKVIKKCYWPLLRLIEKYGSGLGIEATGYTLEKINEIDPAWIKKLKELIENKKTEFVGSGYTQIIGPLVPAEVNRQNLKIGSEVYKSLLGVVPKMAFVNEQAYSRGLLCLYKEAGFESMIMEWNNPATFHPRWNRQWRYYPQIVTDHNGTTLPVVWNNSIAFQKFQRYVHGEISLEEYVTYVKSQSPKDEKKGDEGHNFSFYCSDCEVFDYRPGRFQTETALSTSNNLANSADSPEWESIERFIDAVLLDSSVALVHPSEVLVAPRAEDAWNLISLESPDQPIIVKKQEKYNVARWSLTGRESLDINTVCYKIYENLMQIPSSNVSSDLWKKLCFLWDSDFRTHIEKNKFDHFKTVLIETLKQSESVIEKTKSKSESKAKSSGKCSVEQKNTTVKVTTATMSVAFDTAKGLAIKSIVFPRISSKFLMGTLPHGYYDSIGMSPDFFSGHVIIETPGEAKVTDLAPCQFSTAHDVDSSVPHVELSTNIKTQFGVITKKIRIHKDTEQLDIFYEFDLVLPPMYSFRTGIVTLNPEAFDLASLYYACHNGGEMQEKFEVNDVEFVRADPISLLISARGALGNTTGEFCVGDKDKKLIISTLMSEIASIPMVTFAKLKNDNTYFKRISYSLGETDETCLLRGKENVTFSKKFSVSIRGDK